MIRETKALPAFSPWLMRWPRAIPKLRLFCFPYAGKGASMFSGWNVLVPAELELCGIQLPGKESRIRESPPVSLMKAAFEIAEALEPWLDLPFALAGHSLGSLLAFEVAREIRARRGIEPAVLIVSGVAAPHRLPAPVGLHRLGEKELLEAIEKRYGPFPSIVRQDDELMKLFLPSLRADLTMLETYSFNAAEPLRCPVSAFAGESDPGAPIESMSAWQDMTSGPFVMRVFSGDHFFIQSQRDDFVAAVVRDCSLYSNVKQ